MEKDGSIYKLEFSWDFGVRRKDWKGEEEASVVFLRATSYQHAHASEVCPGRLARLRGAVDLTDAKRPLSKSVGYHCGCTVLFSHSLRGKNFLRPDGGALESEEVGPFSMKLLLISHLWHFYTWRPSLCDYLQSDHVCVMQINKLFIAVDLVRTVMGMALNDFLFGRWGLSFWDMMDWCSLSIWTLKTLLLILATVKSTDWIDCLL